MNVLLMLTLGPGHCSKALSFFHSVQLVLPLKEIGDAGDVHIPMFSTVFHIGIGSIYGIFRYPHLVCLYIHVGRYTIHGSYRMIER